MSRRTRLLIALDYGQKRIGVASGNCLTRTASPLTTLDNGANRPWAALDTLVREWRPDLLLIGDPGPATDTGLRQAIDDFVQALETRYDIAVERVDETLTSVAAETDYRSGRQSGHYNRRLKKGQIDQHAACLIAEQWMNEALDRH